MVTEDLAEIVPAHSGLAVLCKRASMTVFRLDLCRVTIRQQGHTPILLSEYCLYNMDKYIRNMKYYDINTLQYDNINLKQYNH